MALWLLCCILLFITSRGYDWLSHQSWFATPELSLPWLVLGGLGLAIASNYSVWQSLTAPEPPSSAIDDRYAPAAGVASPTVTNAPAVSPPLPPSSAKRSASISFEVTTTKARSSEPQV
jgi:hypothetical protein